MDRKKIKINTGGACKKYASEIIPKLNDRKQEEPYKTFSMMRKIGRTFATILYDFTYGYTNDKATIFVEQAEYMKDFKDNCELEVPLQSYYTTYIDMNDSQLRSYFTWRTKARCGDVQKTSLSYVYCYIYELLNSIGCKSPLEGIDNLIFIWNKYRTHDTHIDKYMENWIKDYYAINHRIIKADFDIYKQKFPNLALKTSKEIEKICACKWDNLSIIEKSSSFRITEGRLYKSLNADIIEHCALFVIHGIKSYFKDKGVSIKKLFVSKNKEMYYIPFKKAVYHHGLYFPFTAKISTYETIKRGKNDWYKYSVSFNKYKSVVGYILKVIEIKMRKHFGFKNNLQMPSISQVQNNFIRSEHNLNDMYVSKTISNISDWKIKVINIIKDTQFEDLIENLISAFCLKHQIITKNNKIIKIEPVKIDIGKLDKIRSDYIETATKLGIDEDIYEKNDVFIPSTIEDSTDLFPSGFPGFISTLNVEERSLIISLLNGQNIPSMVDIELVVEGINEKALTFINDNLVESSDGHYSIYEEYNRELKNLLEVV